MKLRVYIAGFFDTKDRLHPVRDALTSLGYVVTSTWLDEVQTDVAPGKVSTTIAEALEKYKGTKHEDYLSYAVRDVKDIDRSDFLIVDTFDITPRGGREVEVGYAIGTGKPFFVVGPERNVFHKLAKDTFSSWDSAIEFLKGQLSVRN